MSIDNNRMAMTTPDFVEMMSKRDVDVLVTVPTWGNEASYFVAHKKNASIVSFIPAPYSVPYINWANGDPYNPAYVPNLFSGYSQNMNFMERFVNTLMTGILAFAIRDFYVVPKIHSMLEEVFPDDVIPHVHELSKTTSLLINHGSPFLGDGLRPVMPKTILAGGMACKSQSPLTKELREWIEGAEHGVIYVSFGSVIKASKMPEEKRKTLLAVFANVKQRIIWKWETPMPDAPKNILISPWLPQQSILAHDNVKLFITHGGAGSFQETICHKTPIVGIPIQGDQVINIKEAVRKNIGVFVNWHSMTEDILANAVNNVLDDQSYKTAITDLCDLVMDQPQHPMDRAIWWLEYLLRHPQNPGMVTPVHNLWWFQYFLLDVIAVMIGLIIILFYLLRSLFRCCKTIKVKKD